MDDPLTPEEIAAEEAREAEYLSDPRADKVSGWLAIWEIMGRHAEHDYVPTGAGHDMFYFHMGEEQIARDSEDGRLLNRLGVHFDEESGCWAMHT